MSRRLAERAAAAWVSLVATAMVVAGLLTAGMGVTLYLAAFEIAAITAVTSGLMAMGLALAITGAAGVVANRRTSRAPRTPAEITGLHLAGMVAALVALPVLLAGSLTPLAAYWHDVYRAAVRHDVFANLNGPSAMVFLPAAGVLLVPAVQACAAIAIGLHCATVLVLTLMRSAAVRTVSAVGAMLVGGLCVSSLAGVAATERLIPAVEAEIRTSPDANEQARIRDLVERHRSVSMSSAMTLGWGSLALAAIAVVVRMTVRVRAAEAAEDATDRVYSTDRAIPHIAFGTRRHR
jgi:hypothetical protein